MRKASDVIVSPELFLRYWADGLPEPHKNGAPMSKHLVSNMALADQLKKEGLLPEECVSVELVVDGPDSALRLRYVVNVREDDLPKLSRALAACHAELAGEQPR